MINKYLYSRNDWGGIIKALGLVFGDIGTSPIYTLTVIFYILPPAEENVFGIISLLIWTLIILVFIEYSWLAMNLDIDGEGGTLILKKILDAVSHKPGKYAFTGIIAFIGVSLLLGDGVITPSISILSAIEGMVYIPGFANLQQWILILIALSIAVGLFLFQSRGTDKVASAFGPFMLLWFSALTVIGIVSLVQTPHILKAINPYYALKFIVDQKMAAFLILSQVILCATGAEALYADMGHLGKKPITRAWKFVFVALIINYLGQGAYILRTGQTKNFLFELAHSQFPALYIPFLLLTVIATVIASQALISGVFSIINQGISYNVFPRMKIFFTSNKLKSQIYIPSINWFLMISVIFMLILFKTSESLAVAYGLAVSGTMTITGILMIIIYRLKKKPVHLAFAVLVTAIDAVFFMANLNKLQHGGYWSLIIASIPMLIILLWTKGQKRLYTELKPVDIETFTISYSQMYTRNPRINGEAFFFIGKPESVSPYIIHTMIRSQIIYDRNIFLSITRTNFPNGIESDLVKEIAPGLDVFKISAGYNEEIDLEKIIHNAGLKPKVMFYGVEDITTRNFIWKIFSIMKQLTPSFVKFYSINPSMLHGVITRVEM